MPNEPSPEVRRRSSAGSKWCGAGSDSANAGIKSGTNVGASFGAGNSGCCAGNDPSACEAAGITARRTSGFTGTL
jgi:hypothetical protein